MIRSGVPYTVDTLFEEVEAATADLIAAAVEGDASGIERNVGRRGDALRRLTAALPGVGSGLDESEHRRMRDAADRLEEGARQAERALRASMESARGALEAFVRDAAALRGYSGVSSQTSSLDRTG